MIPLMVGPLLALLASVVTLQLLLSPRLHALALDLPNARSLHVRPTPRTGGLAILVGLAVGTCAGMQLGRPASIGLIGLSLGALSFFDDRRGLPVRVRLAAQLAAALTASFVIDGSWAWPLQVLAVLSTVWMTNLYNFMDGSDGLAGGMGALGMGTLALSAGLQGDVELALPCACLTAGCVGFLTRNYPPASIFMGDAGSTSLGFCAAALSLYGVATGAWDLWFPGLVFAPFTVDASFTLLKRLLRGERVWEAHREHYYQRLIRSGFAHVQVLRLYALLMVGTSSSALVARNASPTVGWSLLTGWVLTFAALMRIVDKRWASARSAHENP
jgi:UDP-N-acetylmuramyl pentapeptide phosphotransferase/UDP-N-acetylglucosamine-1-phosphate transferase